jgi:hypothetical protein
MTPEERKEAELKKAAHKAAKFGTPEDKIIAPKTNTRRRKSK